MSINKAILVPLALLLAAWQPWLVTVLLMIGGAYLCFEGFEKIGLSRKAQSTHFTPQKPTLNHFRWKEKSGQARPTKRRTPAPKGSKK